MSARCARPALFLAFLTAAFLGSGCSGYGTRLTFNGGELYYTGAVTKAEAEKLGEFLVKEKFFNGTPKTVQLDKEGNTYLFRMVVKPGFENDVDYQRTLGIFGAELSQGVFDKGPVVLHVCDAHLKTVQVIQPNSTLSFGPARLYYSTSIDKAEAQKLGDVLVKEMFFDGTPKTVQLDKEGNTYLFRMVVRSGAENDPRFEAVFKQMPAELSQKAFENKPVTLHLCDDKWQKIRVIPGR
jgi:hypothetical protein